ncbi:hypothetical protein M0R45_001060 [Rubus argutus]|uniref:Uncharacterized protein n=1 Tax=Rubus argutus TaxID=59490 RepID=A0AAW1VMQ2_RUBAR
MREKARRQCWCGPVMGTAEQRWARIEGGAAAGHGVVWDSEHEMGSMMVNEAAGSEKNDAETVAGLWRGGGAMSGEIVKWCFETRVMVSYERCGIVNGSGWLCGVELQMTFMVTCDGD